METIIEKKRYYIIENKGEILNEALFMMGAGSKRGDSTKIGMFATGNKYALAVLLRNDYDIKVFSGLREIVIGTIPIDFRGNTFDMITIDGEKTGLTTETGLDWKVWMALREFKSNAMDEGEVTDLVSDDINPKVGYTQFYIECTGAVERFTNDSRKYFSEDKVVLFENEHGQILEKHNAECNIYRKGIRCWDDNHNSSFDYNIFNIKIGEDRIVQNSYRLATAIFNLIGQSDDVNIIASVIESTLTTNSYEGYRIDEVINSNIQLNDTWRDYLKDRILIPAEYIELLPEFGSKSLVVSKYLYDIIIHNFPNMRLGNFVGTGDYIHVEMPITDTQMNILLDANTFLRNAGYTCNYSWTIVRFNNKEVKARVQGGKMLFDVSMFSMSQDEINTIFFEEYLHLETGASDYSRTFQNAIFDAWYEQAKQNVESKQNKNEMVNINMDTVT